MSGIHGGGLGQAIATDPFNANGATIGGDSWGVYNTTDAGNTWHAATKGLGVLNDRDPGQGYFNLGGGVAYSLKHPGRVWCLSGKLQNATSGNFGYVEGDTYTVVNTTIGAGESNTVGGLEGDHPRPTGNRIIVDYDSNSGIEYLYAATGNGGGVKRSTADGVGSWTTLGLASLGSAFTGMALDPNDSTKLYVSTRGNKAYRIDGIRGASPTVTQLTNAPTRVEEIVAVGGVLYAAANTSGIYKITNNGSTWTALGGTTFTSTGSAWAAIGGTGSTLYVGCANPSGEKSIAKSTDSGANWTWITPPANVSIQEWGTTLNWWLAAFQSGRVVPGNGGTYETTSIAVDQFNSNIVYSCGKSGCWKSEDGGAHWRPAMNGLGGTMHLFLKVAASGGGAWTDDQDFTNQESTTNFFTTAIPSNDAITFGSPALSVTKGGHTYVLTLSAIRDFTVDGTSIANEFFKSTCVRANDIDVSADGNYIYVAQYGGGVLVAHKTTTPTPVVTITANGPNASEPGTNGQFTLTASPAPASAITVNLAVTGTATNGTDYSTIANTVTIGTGGTASVNVNVVDDAVVEGSESVIVTVQSDTGYTVGTPASATVTIADNDTGGTVGPFTAEDIGSPTLAGSSSLASGVYTIAGAGTDIYNTSDQFQFAHESWSGDGTIVARVTQVQDTHNYAKAAVMFRDGIAANAAHVTNSLTAMSGVQLLHRATAGGTTVSDGLISGFGAPYWIRLDRHGSIFTGYDSPDGLAWFLTGSTTVTLPTGTQVGLAVTSHDTAHLNTSKFDNVSIAALPSWTSADVGTTGAAGSASINYATGLYTVTGSGADIFNGTDAFQYYRQSWTGDAVLIAEVKTVQNTQNYAKAGIMIRKSLAANSAHALIDVTPGPNGIEFNRRLADGNATTTQSVATTLHAPYFIKLVRTGDNFTAYTSPDGGTWTQLGPTENIPMGAGAIYAGLVVCSHVAGTLNTSTFDSVFFAP